MYDLVIVGGGPAATAAGVYASRKQLKTLLITDLFGGQSTVSEKIENWIGTAAISGTDLAKNLEGHLRTYAADIVDIIQGEKVTAISKMPDGSFNVSTDNQNTYNTKTILIATGSSRRKLEVPGAEQFDNKGVTYCASCDGPMFKDQDTVVIGGGNAGFETAAQLLAYAKSVTLLNRGEEFKADPITVKKVLSNPRMKALLNAEIQEVKGDTFVTSVTYKDKESGAIKEIPTQGVFVEIGLLPNTSFVPNEISKNQVGQIIVDHKTQSTSLPGIWAAGDCTDALYHQNNIAAGDGVKALEDIYLHLHTK